MSLLQTHKKIQKLYGVLYLIVFVSFVVAAVLLMAVKPVVAGEAAQESFTAF